MDAFDIKLGLAIVGGLLLAVLLSTATTMKARLTSVVCGLFFACFGTEPLLHWIGWDLLTWKYFFAGVLAMSGDRVARRLMQMVDTGSVVTPWGGSAEK